jgi:endonuclease YncB( thermonuclease family)
VEEELAGCRVGDDGSLVADHQIVEPGLLEVRPHCSEHASGHDDDVGTGRSGACQRLARARAQQAVLGDQRPVEVECESADVRRKRGGELYGAVPPVESTT